MGARWMATLVTALLMVACGGAAVPAARPPTAPAKDATARSGGAPRAPVVLTSLSSERTNVQLSSTVLGGPDASTAVFKTPYSPWTMQSYWEIPTRDENGRPVSIGVVRPGQAPTAGAAGEDEDQRRLMEALGALGLGGAAAPGAGTGGPSQGAAPGGAPSPTNGAITPEMAQQMERVMRAMRQATQEGGGRQGP